MRLIHFDNCPNFRDLGGYKNRQGVAVQSGVLFRSSHLASLNDVELGQLNSLGIRSVFDLRRESERRAFANRLGENTITHEFEIDVGSTKHFFEQLSQGTASRESTHEMMRHSYSRYVTDMQIEFARMMALLAQPDDGGVLLHCMVGKDRTGISVALLLLALDVPRGTIMQDYLLSNEYYPAKKIQQLLMGYLENAGVSEVPDGAMEPFCTVHEDYLQAALDSIDSVHGGTQRYLTETLGLNGQQLEVLKGRFLEA